MSECIAMAIGFGLGAVASVAAVLVAVRMMEGEKREEHNSAPADVPIDGEEAMRKEKLQKQWENFLNYDGTEKGQVSIEDGEE
jgi:hypothetical protein